MSGYHKPWHRSPWPKIRRRVLERDRYLCQIQSPGCTTHATHADHIVSPIHGGEWWNPANLRASCQHCNLTRPNPAYHAREHLVTVDASREW